jgi:hypothetical protein
MVFNSLYQQYCDTLQNSTLTTSFQILSNPLICGLLQDEPVPEILGLEAEQ